MRAALALLMLAGCAPATGGPVVRSAGRPKLVAVYAVPPDSLINADQGVASLYDDYLYYWADTRPHLDSLGVADDTQPLAWTDRRFRVVAGRSCWPMALNDSTEVAYLLLAPGREPRLMSGLRMDLELADSTRAYLRDAPAAAGSRC
jgi:hypothetical protein